MKLFRNTMIFVKVVGAFLIVAAGGIYIGYFGIQSITGSSSQSTDQTVQTTYLLMGGLALLAFLLGIYISNIIAAVNDMAKKLAVGDTNIKKRALASGKLFSSFRDILAAIDALVTDTKMLTQTAIDGSLSTRADAEKHKGNYRKIVEGINHTLDAVTSPINEASAVLSEMAKGNLSTSVTGDYKGDHAVIKNALNETISALRSHIGEISTVLGEMSRGNLHVQIESEYKGDFGELKDSINSTLKALRGYIGEISAVLGEMSQGNFDVGISSEYMGDFTRLKDSINGIIGSLNEVLGEINIAAEQVSAGTSQVSDGNQAISQGATEQASSIEQLTVTVTEIAQQTKQNALSANEANETSTEAKNSAVHGNEQMIALQQAMHELSESSASISKIIKAIDDIAFQTNILALNAAIEAARAGIHGKGFAVVAEEVRNLAARSAGAAKETTNLIEGSIKKTQVGTRIADQAAAALANIMESVDKAVTLVGEIAAASNRQATAIMEVDKGIEQMSLVVQTNSATSQEAAAASEELSSQASILKSMVGRFRFKSGTALSQKKETPAIGGASRNKTESINLSDTGFGKY